MNPRLIQDTVELLNHVGNSLLLKIRGNIFEPGVYVTVVSDIVACINGTYQVRVFFGFGCEKEKCSPVIGQIEKRGQFLCIFEFLFGIHRNEIG